jgi:hypothetical protein
MNTYRTFCFFLVVNSFIIKGEHNIHDLAKLIKHITINKAVHYQKKTKSSVGVHGAQTLIFNVVLCRSLGVLLSILSHMATKSHASLNSICEKYRYAY